ncbi:hypothetical protein GP486_004273, partial [Trichoglossum hirsutum]
TFKHSISSLTSGRHSKKNEELTAFNKEKEVKKAKKRKQVKGIAQDEVVTVATVEKKLEELAMKDTTRTLRSHQPMKKPESGTSDSEEDIEESSEEEEEEISECIVVAPL